MVNPTGKKQRGTDQHGSGAYLAPRGGRVHRGRDYVCIPGQAVFSPIAGRINRVSYPYADGSFSGVEIQNPKMTVKIWYFEPHQYLIGRAVSAGDEIGTAQDISKRYNGITPHVHLEIEHADPEIFMGL